MSFAQTLVIALCTAGSTALLAWLGQFLIAYLQRRNERAKYFREKLLERYSEFAALVAADLERARSVRSVMALGDKDADYAEAKKIEDKRHTLRLDLLRASLQIRLIESDASLAKRVEVMAKAQPFMAFPFPPRWHEGNYDERSERFDSEIAAFDKQLVELIEAVLQKHSGGASGR